MSLKINNSKENYLSVITFISESDGGCVSLNSYTKICERSLIFNKRINLKFFGIGIGVAK